MSDIAPVESLISFDFRKITLPDHIHQVVLHTCCAPCSSAIIKALQHHGVEVTVFFYNPNIHPRAEYERRKAEIVRYADENNVPFYDGDYDTELWHRHIVGYENAPERGHRCQLCFDLRLLNTAAFAQAKGIPYFTTTLASSRWKRLEQIESAGLRAQTAYPATEYWHRNWRKEGLQDLRQQIIRHEGFYNQTYCGCVYSMQYGKKNAAEASTSERDSSATHQHT